MEQLQPALQIYIKSVAFSLESFSKPQLRQAVQAFCEKQEQEAHVFSLYCAWHA